MTVVRLKPRSQGPICDAIASRQLLSIDYGAGGVRVVEAYSHGVNEDGAELVRAYQLSGPGTPSRAVGWRLFRVDRIRNVSLLDDRFEEIRSDFNDREPDIPRNHCQVASEGGRR